MKAKLLKKIRQRVEIIDTQGEIAQPKSKRVSVIVSDKKTWWNSNPDFHAVTTSRGHVIYENYGNALRRKRALILTLARNYNKKDIDVLHSY